MGDTSQVLSRFLGGMTYRCFSHSDVEELAKHADVPVINALSDKHHPCQAAADLMTMLEHFDNTDELKVAWVGDGNNVCNSWIHLTKHYNFKLAISCPEGCFPDQSLLQNFSNDKLKVFSDPSEAVKDADAQRAADKAEEEDICIPIGEGENCW